MARFEKPFSFAETPDVLLHPPPRVQVLASKQERMALFAKLAATGRLQPVRGDPAREAYASGLFAVLIRI